MTDPVETLKSLDRPRLLVSAARIGLGDSNRLPMLRRLLRDTAPPGPEVALERLLEMEARMEGARRAGAADYVAARHVEQLIALMGEARLVLAGRARPGLPDDRGTATGRGGLADTRPRAG